MHCGCLMLDALALLPTQDVCRGMAYVQDNFPDEGEALIIHPSVWWLINCLKDEHSCVSALVLQDEIGNPRRRRTKRVYRDRQERLQNLCIAYDDGQKSLEDFLRCVARNIRLGDV